MVHVSILKRNIFFKAENLQKTGSFKARGAINAVLQLDKSIQAVCCDSSGNHGQALSWAATECGKDCHVAVPKGAPEVKVTAIKEFHNFVVCAHLYSVKCKYFDYDFERDIKARFIIVNQMMLVEKRHELSSYPDSMLK